MFIAALFLIAPNGNNLDVHQQKSSRNEKLCTVVDTTEQFLKNNELLLYAKQDTVLNKSQTRVHTAQFYLYKAPKQARLSGGNLRIGVTSGEPVINWEGV